MVDRKFYRLMREKEGCLQWALILEGERETLGWVWLGLPGRALRLGRLGGRALRLGRLRGRAPRLVKQFLSSEINAHCQQPRERESYFFFPCSSFTTTSTWRWKNLRQRIHTCTASRRTSSSNHHSGTTSSKVIVLRLVDFAINDLSPHSLWRPSHYTDLKFTFCKRLYVCLKLNICIN